MSVGRAARWVAEASPARGAPLIPKVERLAAPLRAAASRLEQLLTISPHEFTEVWGPRVPGLGYCAPLTAQESASRAAWCILGGWLLAQSVGGLPKSATLGDAYRWFVGETPELPPVVVPDIKVFERPVRSETIRALLPYLLDPSAPATRRDVLRGRAGAVVRASRKAAGVYFTPGDVAHFMVAGIADRNATPARWIDLASGSGVFLRAAVSAVSGARVFGLDVEPAAAEMASFVLAAERSLQPTAWATWQRSRLDLATVDSLAVRSGPPSVGDHERERLMAWGELRDGKNPRPVSHEGLLGQSTLVSIGSIFPEFVGGADVVVQNPPYAKPDHARVAVMRQRWGPVPSNVYPLFIRVGLDLLGPRGRMAAVVPSSLVCSSSRHIIDARQDLRRVLGDLEILNFDRAPDGLFGDDIKTRTSVVFLDKGSTAKTLRVGPMVRLTSQTRQQLLRRGDSTSLPPTALTWPLVPKLDTVEHLELLNAIQSSQVPLESMVQGIKRRSLLDPVEGITLAPTAYNWLNVQRSAERARELGHNSASGYWILTGREKELEDAVYAVLSSRVAFWTWRTFGDGFHVARWLLGVLPGVEEEESTQTLAKLGRELWERVNQSPVVSINGGRRSIAFPASTAEADLVDEIDARLLESLGLSVDAVNLRAWMRDLAIAGRSRSYGEPVESVDQE